MRSPTQFDEGIDLPMDNDEIQEQQQSITVISNDNENDEFIIKEEILFPAEDAVIANDNVQVHIVWSTVDEAIENVVRQSVLQTIAAEEENPDTSGITSASEAKQKKKLADRDRDPLSLPFSYAGQSFNVQSQKLILNVMHFFKTHKKDEFIDTIKTPQEKAARVLNVSSSVIGKIRKNWQNGKLILPGKKRRMLKRVLDRVSDNDEATIRDIINDFCNKCIVPTIPLILASARERIQFVGSRTSFRRILHRMGYKYGKIDKRMVMIDPYGSAVQSQQSSPLRQTPQRSPQKSPSTATSTSQVFAALVPLSSSSSQQTVTRPKLVHEVDPLAPTISTIDPETQMQLGQFERIQFFTQQSQINRQQFTTPVQGYSRNLPISVATPHQQQNQNPPKGFHLVQVQHLQPQTVSIVNNL